MERLNKDILGSGLLPLVVQWNLSIRTWDQVYCPTVEPLNKGHIGIRSTVPCSTVEHLNKGHIGIRSCKEAVLISEVNLHLIKPWYIFRCPL